MDTMTVFFEYDGKVYRLDVPESEDVWDAIAKYDEAHGTDFWDHLDDSNVLGVNLEEYPEAASATSWDSIETVRIQMEIEGRMPALIMEYGLSPREAQAVILSDMGMGPQEIADILGRMLGTSMTRQSITNALRKARIKMAIDREE